MQLFSEVLTREGCGGTMYVGDNEGITSHNLCIDTITVGSILLTINLVALKRGNSEPILVVKRTEWRKFIDFLGLSTEA